MNPVEREKLVQEYMKRAEGIALEIFHDLRKRLGKDKLSVADGLHVGVVLSCCLITAAVKNRNDVQKEELLEQFKEALTDHVLEGDYELVPLN